MSAELAAPKRIAPSVAVPGAGFAGLRRVAIAAGIGWSLVFVVLGLAYRLQMYGDGSIFSYAVAVQDAWAIHSHNIPGRMFVYLLCLAPAQAYVGWTQDVGGGLALYGLAFLGAQLAGLVATFALDRSAGRVMFGTACASTACLCPLVFGFPTEMWMAHALFWPTLTLAHHGGGGVRGFLAVLLVMLAFVFTHEGAVVLAVAILMTLLLRGPGHAAFRRAAGAFAVVIVVWVTVKVSVHLDDYITDVMTTARDEFFDPWPFIDSVFGLEVVALASYAALFAVLRRLGLGPAPTWSAMAVAAGLAAYWLMFEPPLHTQHRYHLRTALVLAMPCFAVLAVVWSGDVGGWAKRPAADLSGWLAILDKADTGRVAAIGLLLLTLVNAVETARFVAAWSAYTAAVRDLATGSASDPQLGDPRFVSSDRIDSALRPLSWNSTTPFLSVLVAPGYRPSRLVIDPTANYFWLPCRLATAQEHAAHAIPVESRRLIRVHACLHR